MNVSLNRSETPGLMKLLQTAYLDNKEGSLELKDLGPLLNPYITVRVVEKGDDIIRPMDTLSYIHLIVRGKAYFIRTSPRGETNMLAESAAPMFIGVTQLISNDKEFYSQILAVEQCLILDIDCKYFLNGLKEDGSAALVVIQDLSRIVERNHERMDRMVFLNSTDNLMAYICRKWLEAGGGTEPLAIKERHEVIATNIGISVRTLYRAINKLKAEELISVQNNGVMVFTPVQLQAIKDKYEIM